MRWTSAKTSGRRKTRPGDLVLVQRLCKYLGRRSARRNRWVGAPPWEGQSPCGPGARSPATVPYPEARSALLAENRHPRGRWWGQQARRSRHTDGAPLGRVLYYGSPMRNQSGAGPYGRGKLTDKPVSPAARFHRLLVRSPPGLHWHLRRDPRIDPWKLKPCMTKQLIRAIARTGGQRLLGAVDTPVHGRVGNDAVPQALRYRRLDAGTYPRTAPHPAQVDSRSDFGPLVTWRAVGLTFGYAAASRRSALPVKTSAGNHIRRLVATAPGELPHGLKHRPVLGSAEIANDDLVRDVRCRRGRRR